MGSFTHYGSNLLHWKASCDTAWDAVRRAYEPCSQRICAAVEKRLCLDPFRSSVVLTEVWVSLATPARNGSHWQKDLWGFFRLAADVPVTPRLTISSFSERYGRSWLPSEHWKPTQEFPKAQCLWPKGHSTFGSFAGRCRVLLAYLLSTFLLKVQLWKPSWEQNFFKNECPHCSLICGYESLASKYYGHEDFTDFYFMLNV